MARSAQYNPPQPLLSFSYDIWPGIGAFVYLAEHCNHRIVAGVGTTTKFHNDYVFEIVTSEDVDRFINPEGGWGLLCGELADSDVVL